MERRTVARRNDEALDVVLPALEAAGDFAYCWTFDDDRIVWVGSTDTFMGDGTADIVLTGKGFHGRIVPDDLTTRLQALDQHLDAGNRFDCEYRVLRDDGSVTWIHDRGTAVRDADGRPLKLLGTLRIVTERKRQESLLEQRANFDDLTGHLNKIRLREALQSAVTYNQRYKVTGGYLAVGIDKLSMINDAYGHEIADAVIIAISRRIERCLRTADVIGRIGGDRFGLILAHCDENGLRITAEKILEAFRSEPIEAPAGTVHVTVSIGGVSFPGMIRTAHDAMTGAESALQDAKNNGRNCFVQYTLSDEQRDQQRHNIAVGEQVMKALEEGRIVLAYQPVVDAKTWKPKYCETLIRMLDEDGSVISAGAFVPIVEKLGLIRLLDLRALELAVRELTTYPEVSVAVNVSSLTVTDPAWMRTLMSLVKGKDGIAPRLMVEITETAALEDFEVTGRFVAAVRALGCKVALDDFGSGYTSFRHMKALTVDVVKIDGAFVTDVANNVENQVFIKTLMGLADGFGLSTVAECIETEDDAKILSREGADYLQGWYFGKPVIDPPWRSAATASPDTPERPVGTTAEKAGSPRKKQPVPATPCE